MTENGNNSSKKRKPLSKLSFRSLKLSLKYRPEILKLILKMRQCIRKRNSLVKSLKQRLNQLETKTKNESTNVSIPSNTDYVSVTTETKTLQPQDCTLQTIDNNAAQSTINDIDKLKNKLEQSSTPPQENTGWNLTEGGDTEKSIAEQVKEAAQSALQDTGMVYVESAGMYYDYKTGYYYNSELGLYYHTDTGCYYYYSEDKQFVFHSYPDMSKVNASLIAHQNKKARKLKRERKPEDDVDNLTKDLSQDKEDGGNPKKARKSKKDKKEKKARKGQRKSKEEKMEITDDNLEKEKEKVMVDKNISDTKTVDLTENQNQDDQIKSHNTDEDIFEIKDEKTETGSKDSTEGTTVAKENTPNVDEDKEEVQEIKDDEGEKKEMEDGECSDTDSEDESDGSTSTVSDEDSIAKHHPPCMRVIVRETKLAKLKAGSLFLITKDGGTIGREGEHHAVLLKDHNVSRNHLDIRYDMARKTYFATDLGSKNGTILNGVRMSESQEISLPLDVLHGSTIQLGETKLLCHIHPGHTTCGQCEPGLLMQAEEEKKVAYTRTVSVKKQYELELARLKNTYAPQYLAIEEKPYNDRAQARREAVGSTNHAEKTQAVDLDTSIAADNKGFKLLQKMGWSKGEGLGKDSQGDTEPVPLISNEGKAGLGTTGAVAPPSNTPRPRVIKNNIASGMMRLAARTNMLRPPAKAFQNDDDDDDDEKVE